MSDCEKRKEMRRGRLGGNRRKLRVLLVLIPAWLQGALGQTR